MPTAPSPLPDPAAFDVWLFDLDNCLYPAGTGFFAQMDVRIGEYVQRATGLDAVAARGLQKHYFHDHGTTLAGLMADHGVNAEDYLAFVHDLDIDMLAPDQDLARAIAALPGRRHIFTNADANYAHRIIERRGLAGLFHGIIDIRATGFAPKPHEQAYATIARTIDGFDPARTIFVDDMSRNLRPAHRLGITTVWLDNGSEAGDRDHDPTHVDHHITDLCDWLTKLHNRDSGHQPAPALQESPCP